MLYKAGAIILNLEANKILLIYRGKERDWSFPKGHVEDSESAEQTMTREIAEETGLEKISNTSPLPDFAFEHPLKGHVVIKMFLGHGDESENLQPEKPYDKLEWTPIEHVANKLSYDNLKKYFENNLSLIHDKSIK